MARILVSFLAASLLIIPASSGSVADAAVRQVALGVSVWDDQNPAEVDAHIAAVGTTPAIWTVWSDWGWADKNFPTAFMNELKSRGIVPMVNWQPIGPGDECSLWSLDPIINGVHDAYIRQWAQDAKAYGGRVIVRFAHEMNGYWFPWGASRCTNTPAKFKQAWIRIWNIFRGVGGEGATNVKFLWSPYGTSQLKAHYPGKKYVDYAGFTAFNWGPNGLSGAPSAPWRTMKANYKTTVRAISRVARRKPLIAAETGAAYLPNCASCDKVAWIRTGYPAVYAKWPRIVAIVYFDIDLTVIANQPNWRLDSPAGALAAYRNVANDARFQGRIP
ncbi:MAG: glycosyl hydrolase [Chloroflexota bacterium]